MKIGDKLDFVTQKRSGKSITFEKKNGEIIKLRTVKQALVKSGKTLKWVDLED